MLLERRDLLELLADGDRLAHLDGDEWVFEGTRKRCATDLMSRLIPEHVNYAGVMRAPHPPAHQ